jgi:hypothetical protein
MLVFSAGQFDVSKQQTGVFSDKDNEKTLKEKQYAYSALWRHRMHP